MKYAAFLRGVMPTNCRMPELKRAFEAADFEEVRTILGSGNVVFETRKAAIAALERKADAGMKKVLGRSFAAFIRPVEALGALLEEDPFEGHELPGDAKRIVTFLHAPPADPPRLPIVRDGAHLLVLRGTELLSAYTPTPKGPVFMKMIEQAVGRDQTTRTWETIARVVA